MIIRPQRFLCETLLESAQRAPGRTAIVVEGQAYTYQDLEHSAKKMASALLQHGVEREDRVGIYMDNTWPCIVSIYAVSLIGGVFLVINPQTKPDKLEYIIKDSGAKILMSDAHLREQMSAALVNLPELTHVICSGDSEGIKLLQDEFGDKVSSFNDALDSASPLEEHINVTPSDLAALIYTSGSTGHPKGVMHSNLSMMFAIGSLIEYLRLNEEHVLLNVLPFAFDYGLYQLLMTITMGATLVLERSFTYPAVVFKRIEEHEITTFPGVPTIFSMLLAAHRRKKICFPSITRVTNTAAALPAEYIEGLREIFPNALIYKMYGLTECKRVCYLEPELLEERPRSVGKAIPGTETYLLTKEGKPAKPGETGILHVRGPHIMLGYWNQPEMTDHMLKPGKLPGERVLCTHDWFNMDEEGFLYFIGRSDDIIKTRGEKVSPIEVENVLHGIDGVNEAAVVGVPDDTLGEIIRAYVAIDTDSDLSDKKIRKICMSRLENFMVPQEVIILDELPKTATGKISKKTLGQ
ncbi:MAG: AMP-binding protein [Gammaproteobacteria bacterium]|nr:AMP-binding protein [Gammaproteobacteria bacterium]